MSITTRYRATGIVVNNGKILVIQRIHKGDRYMVFPGGGVDADESTEEALVRELRDELTIETKGYTRLRTTRKLSMWTTLLLHRSNTILL